MLINNNPLIRHQSHLQSLNTESEEFTTIQVKYKIYMGVLSMWCFNIKVFRIFS